MLQGLQRMLCPFGPYGGEPRIAWEGSGGRGVYYEGLNLRKNNRHVLSSKINTDGFLRVLFQLFIKVGPSNQERILTQVPQRKRL